MKRLSPNERTDRDALVGYLREFIRRADLVERNIRDGNKELNYAIVIGMGDVVKIIRTLEAIK